MAEAESWHKRVAANADTGYRPPADIAEKDENTNSKTPEKVLETSEHEAGTFICLVLLRGDSDVMELFKFRTATSFLNFFNDLKQDDQVIVLEGNDVPHHLLRPALKFNFANFETLKHEILNTDQFTQLVPNLIAGETVD